MRRTALLLTLLAFPGAAAAQAPAPVPNVAAVRKAIDARNAEWVAAANRGDVKGISKIYDEGAMIIPPESEPMTGTANIEAVFGGLLNAGARNLKFETHSLDVNGNYAYELGVATYEVPDKDGRITKGSDKYLVIWKLGKDGIWYYHLDTWWAPSPVHSH
jgi:ketosteroid isomerase-like protein